MKPSNIILFQALAFYATGLFLALPSKVFPEIQFLTGGTFQTLFAYAATYSPKNAFFTFVLVFLAISAFNFVLAGILLTREFFRTRNNNSVEANHAVIAKKAFRIYCLFLGILVAAAIAYSQGVDISVFFY